MSYCALGISSFCEVAGSLAGGLKSKGGVVFLRGELGVGKTLFCRSLVERVFLCDCFLGSPTFGLVNEYKLGGICLFHVDLYRLKSVDEVYAAGIVDIITGGGISLVEWPEVMCGLISCDIDVGIEYSRVCEDARDVCISYRVP